MPETLDDNVVDTITLRFVGEDEDGNAIHELRATHVAEVLQGLVGLANDFDKAGVFNPEGIRGSEVLVRPAKEGSFLIEVVRVVTENHEAIGNAAAFVGAPSLGTVIWWATRSAVADVKDFDYLDNGNVKVVWQDGTADEVPVEAWKELNKRTRRRKKHLRQIMTPLSDKNVTSVEVTNNSPTEDEDDTLSDAPDSFVLVRSDYNAVRLEDEIEEYQTIFEAEATMSAIDFDNPAKWRVKTKDETRSASVEDNEFLAEVAQGLAIRKTDIFVLRIREDVTLKNGRKTTTWTVLNVEGHRRAAGEDS